MIDACKRAGVLLQINHNRRWHSHWLRVKELVDSGAIGLLNHIYCYMDGGKPAPWWRAENEGPLLHDFTHYFDLLDMYVGDVDWLCGMAEQRSRPWAVEDFTAAFIKFKNGVTALVSGAELSDYDDSGMELRGSTGVIRYGRSGFELLQSEPDVYEPDSGFQWSTLQPRDMDLPPEGSTYVAALEELAGRPGREEHRPEQRRGRPAVARNRDGHLPVAARRLRARALPRLSHVVRSQRAAHHRPLLRTLPALTRRPGYRTACGLCGGHCSVLVAHATRSP